jgi:hypothetical protein
MRRFLEGAQTQVYTAATLLTSVHNKDTRCISSSFWFDTDPGSRRPQVLDNAGTGILLIRNKAVADEQFANSSSHLPGSERLKSRVLAVRGDLRQSILRLQEANRDIPLLKRIKPMEEFST